MNSSSGNNGGALCLDLTSRETNGSAAVDEEKTRKAVSALSRFPFHFSLFLPSHSGVRSEIAPPLFLLLLLLPAAPPAPPPPAAPPAAAAAAAAAAAIPPLASRFDSESPLYAATPIKSPAFLSRSRHLRRSKAGGTTLLLDKDTAFATCSPVFISEISNSKKLETTVEKWR